ncbi:hypothetical protein NEUTE2DRAFT_168971 [Neurospora tetrasperma FGSC 2509]|nr:hypothetical protein NEUTE2DRAFT_168971 [Neurospora tetrasperma FGSC 2509]
MCKSMAFIHRLAYTSLHGRHFRLDLTFMRAASHSLQIRNDAVNRQSLISMILQKQQVDVGRDMTNHHRQREFMKIPNGMTQCILLLNPHSLSSHPRSVLNVSLCNDKFATREESMRRTCTNDIVHAAR